MTKDQSTLSTMVFVYSVVKSCSAFGALGDGRIVRPNSFAKTHCGKCLTVTSQEENTQGIPMVTTKKIFVPMVPSNSSTDDFSSYQCTIPLRLLQ